MKDIYDWYQHSSAFLCAGSIASAADSVIDEDWVCSRCSYTNVDVQNPVCSVCGENSSITISINYTGCAKDYPSIKLSTSLSNDFQHQTKKRSYHYTGNKELKGQIPTLQTRIHRQALFSKTRDNMIDHDIDDRPPEMTRRHSSENNMDERTSKAM
mmetsp:Transcript_2284/g.3009  ORF Transcript_2284/g.3009 Transcript_2284/m.3009 type:complete len:156 (+) Transcript_2284:115-582(+)